MDEVRVDKWLWAVRLFKTRGLAAKACEGGKVKCGERVLKASSDLRGGELIEMPFAEGPGMRLVRVLALIEKRVGAPEAKLACEDLTPSETLDLRKNWTEAQTAARTLRQEGDQGRPTKKNRRDRDLYHGYGFPN
jgi:ribosome-associated heat shock protein Hsp15